MNKAYPRLMYAFATALCFFVNAHDALAAFPEKPIRLIVPFDPGGGTDLLARFVGQKLSEVISQPVIVENKPGAAGTIGVAYTAREKPDGYTLVLVNALAHTASTNFYPDLSYDAVKSFTPIGAIGTVPYMLVVNPKFPATGYADFVKVIRSAPGKFNGASAGTGSAPHLALELFKRTVGLDIVHVPYKGSGPALNDVMGGRVELEFENVAAAPHVKSGKLRAIAVTGKRRRTAFPELPTFAEQGQSDFDVVGYWGFLAPAGVPADVVSILNRALVRVVGEPANRAQLNTLGLEAEAGTADEYGAILRSESAKWSLLIREANIKP